MTDKPGGKAGGRLGGTRPGVGVDQKRPPVPVDPGKRRLARPVAVALAMLDPIERSNVGKALVQARCRLTAIDVPADATREALDDVEVLVADFDAPAVFAIVEEVRRARPDLPVLAWTNRGAMVERGLAMMGFSKVEVLERTARVPALVEAVQRLAGA